MLVYRIEQVRATASASLRKMVHVRVFSRIRQEDNEA
jgi:hypothetical protein